MKPGQQRYPFRRLDVGHPGQVASLIVQDGLMERAAAPDTEPPAALSRTRHPVDPLPNAPHPPPGPLDGCC